VGWTNSYSQFSFNLSEFAARPVTIRRGMAGSIAFYRLDLSGFRWHSAKDRVCIRDYDHEYFKRFFLAGAAAVQLPRHEHASSTRSLCHGRQ